VFDVKAVRRALEARVKALEAEKQQVRLAWHHRATMFGLASNGWPRKHTLLCSPHVCGSEPRHLHHMPVATDMAWAGAAAGPDVNRATSLAPAPTAPQSYVYFHHQGLPLLLLLLLLSCRLSGCSTSSA
jgi:hypothetical protein